MKQLYLECNMGAAGDMLAAALYEVCDGAQQAEFLRVMRGLALPRVCIEPQAVTVCGVTATHMAVTVDGHEEGADETVACAAKSAHAHRHADADVGHASDCADAVASAHHHAHDDAHDHGSASSHTHTHAAPAALSTLLDSLALPAAVRGNAKAVYTRIAQAESRVHGVPVTEIHFHEVGALDAVADVAAVCLLMHLLQPDKVLASPVATGSGTVKCAHGVLPVPAPATALLLAGVPVWAGPEQGELCTPTGAALLRQFVTTFVPMPIMTIEKIGCGAGRKRFATANLVRAFWGAADVVDAAVLHNVPNAIARTAALDKAKAPPAEPIVELCCNLDDATAEEIGFALEHLLRAGALDAFTAPIGMKKCRPATLLTALCRPADADGLATLLLQHTPTLGVRRRDCTRYTLARTVITVETPYGAVRVKVAAGHGAAKAKPEYDDVAAAALRAGVPFATVHGAALRAALTTTQP